MADMTEAQATIAVPLLNSYAHQYLGLPPQDVLVSAGRKNGRWFLLVGTPQNIAEAADFDEAKQMIDLVVHTDA